MVTNHLLTGMILQAPPKINSWKLKSFSSQKESSLPSIIGAILDIQGVWARGVFSGSMLIFW